MNNFEFLNSSEASTAANDEAKSVDGAYADFADGLIYINKRYSKLAKKNKKTCKKLIKQSKQLKKEVKLGKELNKKVKALSGELSGIKLEVVKFRNIAREGLFKDLISCENVSERKRLIEEIRRMEVFE